jgi:hypothetical protein
MSMEQPFSLGVGYWPRTRGSSGRTPPPYSWLNIDYGAVRDELAHIVELGFDTLRLELRWEEFQPAMQRLGSPAMQSLELLLDETQAKGLRAVISLLSGSMAGALALPRWATGLRPSDPEAARRLGIRYEAPPEGWPLLSEDGYHRSAPRDLYGEREQRQAQGYLVRELIGYFAKHPAVWQWLLGANLFFARQPDNAPQAASWWLGLSNLVRSKGAEGILGHVSAASLAQGNSLRPGAIAAAGAGIVVGAQPTMPLALNEPWRAGHLRFLLELVGALASETQTTPAPIYLDDVGVGLGFDDRSGRVSDLVLGREAMSYLANEEQQGLFIEEALEGLARAGAAGVWLSAYNDRSTATWNGPPLDKALARRQQGLITAAGHERPAAAAVRTFAGRLQSGLIGGSPGVLPIEPDRYWRAPREQLGALFAEWEG